MIMQSVGVSKLRRRHAIITDLNIAIVEFMKD